MNFNIGPRMVKTGLAVALTLIITDLLDLKLEIVAALAAVLAMQPSIMRSYNYIKEVVISNGVGLLFALLGILLLGHHPLSVGAVVIISIAINIRLGLYKTVSLTVLTIITLMLSMTDGFNLLYALDRISLVAIGVFSAFIINMLVFPPNHQKIIFTMIQKASNKTSFLLRVIPDKAMSIPLIKQEDREIVEFIQEAEQYYDIITEERSRLFIKSRRRFYQHIVIYKHMIDMLKKKQTLIQQLEQNRKEMEHIPKQATDMIEQLILELNNYSENIILLFENKIVLNKDLQKKAKHQMQVTINDFIQKLQNTDTYKWHFVFPIATSIIELFYALDKLERLIRIIERKKTDK